MARKILQLAGGTYTSLAALSGGTALNDRELVVTSDTHELYIGDSTGRFHLAGQALFGDSATRTTTPSKPGRFFYDTTTAVLYMGVGSYEASVWTAMTDPNKISKMTGATAGHLVVATADGSVADSGKVVDDGTSGANVLWSSARIAEAINDAVNGLSWQPSVKEATSTPPAVPVAGDRYLVYGTGIDEFAGHDNAIAYFNGSAWSFAVPADSWAVFANDTDTAYVYTGTEWVEFASAVAYTAGNGIQLVGKTIAVKPTTSSSALTADTNGLKVNVDSTSIEVNGSNNLAVKLGANSALKTTDGYLGVKVDETTLGITSGALHIKTLATGTALNTAPSGELRVAVDGDTLVINASNQLEVNALDFGTF